MSFWYRVGLLFTILLFFCVPALAADTTSDGGKQGWYVIHCNVQGAKVYLDDKYVGDTQGGVVGGTLTVPVYTTGTAPATIRVQKYGYTTFVNSLTTVPADGGTADLYVTLNQLPATTVTSVGGDVGWYVVHCNIDGAMVTFDGSNKGVITRGVVYVPVYSSGTPYTQYMVTKDGYSTYSAYISNVPGKGETIDLYATLNPVVTTATTAVKIGGDIGLYTVHCNVEGATVSFDNDVKGQIAQGNLTVKVYVTGTPYKTFTVYKSGYVPYTGTIDSYPAKSETVDLYATLNAQQGTTSVPITSPTRKSPVAVWMCGFALVLALGMLKK